MGGPPGWNRLYLHDKQEMHSGFDLNSILNRSRIHERTISLRALRLQVSVYITSQFHATFAGGEGGGSKIR